MEILSFSKGDYMEKLYSFKARNKDGKIIKSSLLVKSEEEFKEILLKEKLFLISYKVKKKQKRINQKGIKKQEVINFLYKMSILLKSGVSITDSLENVINGVNNKKFKMILSDILHEILKGKKLSMVLKKYDLVFPNIVIKMVGVAEVSGNLEFVFSYCSSYLSNEKRINDKIKSSMLYPYILMFLTFVIVIVMFIFIIPMYEDMFKGLSSDIPKVSRIVFLISDYFKKYFVYFFIGLLSLILLFKLLIKNKKIKYFLSFIKTKIPVFKDLIKLRSGSVFIKTVHLLNSSGLTLIDSLEVAVENVSNLYYKKKLKNSIVDVKKGISITSALEKANVMPDILIEMLPVAEKTGTILEVLEINYQYFDSEIEKKINRLITLIEPLMIVFISLIIVVIMIAVFIPMFSLMDNIGGF